MPSTPATDYSKPAGWNPQPDYDQIMGELLIDPQKVSAEAARITHSSWDEILDTSEHKTITAQKRKPSGTGTVPARTRPRPTQGAKPPAAGKGRR